MNALQRNLDVVRGLKPELLWRYFAELSTIPRGSENEAAVAEFVYNLAKQRGFSAIRDKKNNVVVYVPATAGFEHRTSVCLQGHTDMVCEKLKGNSHNFVTDPIEFVMKDRNLMANGTTLGADNGIGAAAMLAIMMHDLIEHGPLELLFTTEEEIGFHGAQALDPNLIKSENIINLDSEELGEFFVGCAGGGRVSGTLNLTYVPSATLSRKCCLITVKDLKGGHSGLEIHLGRANAIKLLGETLQTLTEFGLEIVSLTGGKKMNAIPREAEALVMIPDDQFENASAAFSHVTEEIRLRFQATDPNLKIEIDPSLDGSDKMVLPKDDRDAVLELLETLPHGVISMVPNTSVMVQTSNNVAIIATEGDKLIITCMFRSSVEADMDEMELTIRGMIEKANGTAEILDRYPAWEPNFDTPLLSTAKQVYQELYGVTPAVKTIHAGLECAEWCRMFPGRRIISFGPTMHYVHTPDECIEVDTVEKFWDYLLKLLQAVGDSNAPAV